MSTHDTPGPDQLPLLARRGFLRGIAATGLGAGLAGITSTSWGHPAQATAMATLSVQSLWINDAEFAGYFVAQDRKYYTPTNEGYERELQKRMEEIAKAKKRLSPNKEKAEKED